MNAILAALFLAVTTVIPEGPVKVGQMFTFEYEHPDKTPLVFSGWCKTEDAVAVDCCIYLDIWYENGEAVWGRKAMFHQGTHDWESAQAFFVPTHPVKTIKMHALFRNPAKAGKPRGRAEFKDFKLERRLGNGEKLQTSKYSMRPFSDEFELAFDEMNGDKITTVRKRIPDESPRLSPISNGTVRVWTEDSMKWVSPLTFPGPEAKKHVAITLAGRERESAQVLISTAADVEWFGAELILPQLKRKDGTPFKGTVKWERQGYLPREAGASPHPMAIPENEMWFPDPLLPAAPMRVRKASTQGAWITVYAEPDAEPGIYSGTISVREQGVEKAKVLMAVKVLPFVLPQTFGLKTAYALMDCYTYMMYPEDFDARLRESWDIMLDHRLNPDNISRTTPPDIELLKHARERGMNCFNILNVVPPPKKYPKTSCVLVAKPEEIFNDEFYNYFIGVVKPYVEELKKEGLDKYAYIYGFDERTKEFYQGIYEFWQKLQRDVPGIPLMATAKNYRDYVKGGKDIPYVLSGDWYCPVTSDYNLEVNEMLRKEGKQVWWYTCCGPYYPYANFASWEYPLIEGRILGWMTHRWRADGFLFWVVNKWHQRYRFKEDDTFFPDYRTFNGNGVPGDGIFMFPGEKHILPGMRLAQGRDAVEDYEYLQLAEKAAGQAATDAVTDSIVKTLIDFSRDPHALRVARMKLAELIESGK